VGAVRSDRLRHLGMPRILGAQDNDVQALCVQHRPIVLIGSGDAGNLQCALQVGASGVRLGRERRHRRTRIGTGDPLDVRQRGERVQQMVDVHVGQPDDAHAIGTAHELLLLASRKA